MTGLRVCDSHGGGTVRSRAKSQKAKQIIALQGMKKFTTPIDIDDPEADPFKAFELEHRRTLAHIRYFDEKLSEIKEEHLIWGQTKREEIGAGTYDAIDAVNQTFEAAANLYYTLQWEERKHLRELHKIWISANLDERKLEIEKSKVDMLDTVITRVLTKVGLDVHSPEIRAVVRDELLALPAIER